MKYVLCFIVVFFFGCPKENVAEPPVMAGAEVEHTGEGVIEAGNNPGNIQIKTDLEELCLTGDWKTKFAPGTSVKFSGKKQAVTPLKGENCQKFTPNSIEQK